VAVALGYLKRGQVKRIVLTRPAVEAGEELGFLPGDILQKVNPYLRPLYDAIYDMIPVSEFEKYMTTGRIEIAPTGDVTQVDIEGRPSGLQEVRSILAGIPGIAFVYLDRRDVVRHPLVKAIIEAYERSEKKKETSTKDT